MVVTLCSFTQSVHKYIKNDIMLYTQLYLYYDSDKSDKSSAEKIRDTSQMPKAGIKDASSRLLLQNQKGFVNNILMTDQKLNIYRLGPQGFVVVKLYQKHKDVIPIHHKFFQKIDVFQLISLSQYYFDTKARKKVLYKLLIIFLMSMD